ncbi:MAG: hypothetical protein JJ992_14120 [Planctomycetes bacterium]|jgi:hypothetical protein|nr:hypothetical protein [Planctomycetota bacterium]
MDLARASRLFALSCAVAFLCVATGCATEFEKRFDEAEHLRQQAAERGYEWIGTADLLEQAEGLAAEGDTESALELVEEARFQSAAALAQAEREAGAWQRRVVK